MKMIFLLFVLVVCAFARLPPTRSFVDPANVHAIHFNASAINETAGARIPHMLHVVCIWPFGNVPDTKYVNESGMLCLSNMHETHAVVAATVDCIYVPVADERLTSTKTIVQDSCRLAIRLGTFAEFLEYHEQHIDFSHQDQAQVRKLMRARWSASQIADVYDAVFSGARDFEHQIIEHESLWSYVESICDEMVRECNGMANMSISQTERNNWAAKFILRIGFVICFCGFVLSALCWMFGLGFMRYLTLICGVSNIITFAVFHFLSLKAHGDL